MFWGVADSRSIADYQQNIRGVWLAIPQILKLFEQYNISATWATVGMLMCKNHAQWSEIRPTILPGYTRKSCSTYTLSQEANEYPELFFARPLVEQIKDLQNQEIATHTYSHFYCGEDGATPEQLTADLECANFIAAELGVTFQSIVLPRNQVLTSFLEVLPASGIGAYRGNPEHFLYRDGHFVQGGLAGRMARFTDGWLPVSGDLVEDIQYNQLNGLTNIPASLFLRPYSNKFSAFESLRLNRMKKGMTAAAKGDGIFHLWWHPHNFGINIGKNIAVLESLLKHFQALKDCYGMESLSMGAVNDLKNLKKHQIISSDNSN